MNTKKSTCRRSGIVSVRTFSKVGEAETSLFPDGDEKVTLHVAATARFAEARLFGTDGVTRDFIALSLGDDVLRGVRSNGGDMVIGNTLTAFLSPEQAVAIVAALTEALAGGTK